MTQQEDIGLPTWMQPQVIQGGLQPRYGQSAFYRQFQRARYGGGGYSNGGGGGGGQYVNPQVYDAQKTQFLADQSAMQRHDEFMQRQKLLQDQQKFQRDTQVNGIIGQMAARNVGAPEGSNAITPEGLAAMRKMLSGDSGGGDAVNPGAGSPNGQRPWGMRSDGTPMTTAERQMQTPTPEIRQQWRQQEQQHIRNMPAGMPEKNMPIDAMLGAVTDPQQKLAALEYMRKNFADVPDIPLAGRPMTPRQAEASMALKGFRVSGDEASTRNFTAQNEKAALDAQGYGGAGLQQGIDWGRRAMADVQAQRAGLDIPSQQNLPGGIQRSTVTPQQSLNGAGNFLNRGLQAVDQAAGRVAAVNQQYDPNPRNAVPGMTALSDQGLQNVREFGQGLNIVGGNRDVVDAAAMARAGYNPQQQADLSWLAALPEDQRMRLMQGQRIMAQNAALAAPVAPSANPAGIHNLPLTGNGIAPPTPTPLPLGVTPADIERYGSAKQLYTNAQNYGQAGALPLPNGQMVQPNTIPGNDAGAKARMLASQMAGQGMNPVQILQHAQSTGNQELAQLASSALENAGRYGSSIPATGGLIPGATPWLETAASTPGLPGLGMARPGSQPGDVRPMPQPVAPVAQAPAANEGSNWYTKIPKTGIAKMQEDVAAQNLADRKALVESDKARAAGRGAGSKIGQDVSGLGSLGVGTGASLAAFFTLGASARSRMAEMQGTLDKMTTMATDRLRAIPPEQRYHAADAIKESKAYTDAKDIVNRFSGQSLGKQSAALLVKARAFVQAVDDAAVPPQDIAGPLAAREAARTTVVATPGK